jgi:hypothetical protein
MKRWVIPTVGLALSVWTATSRPPNWCAADAAEHAQRRELVRMETSGYRTQGFVNSAPGIEDQLWNVWTKQNGFDLFAIVTAATQSVQQECAQGCGP